MEKRNVVVAYVPSMANVARILSRYITLIEHN